MKFFKRLTYLFSMLLLALVLMFMFAVSTNVGLKMSLVLAEYLVPGHLTIIKPHGRLISSIHANQVLYQHHRLKVSLHDVDIDWNLSRLLLGKLIIQQLTIKQAKIHTLKKQLTLQHISLHGIVSKNHIQLALQALAANKPPIKIHLTVTGVLHDYLMKLKLYNRNTDWGLRGRGNLAEITFLSQPNKILSGSLTVQGNIHWSPNLSWHVSMQGKQLDIPLSQDNALHKLNFSFRGHGKKDSGELQMQQFNGQLQNKPLHGNLYIAYKNNKINSLNLQLYTHRASLMAKGAITNHWQLIWYANIPNLNNIYTKLTGSLISQGKISGALEDPQFTADITANNLTYHHYILADKIKLFAQGKLSNNTLHATLLNRGRKLHLILTGGLVKEKKQSLWQGALTQLNLSGPKIGSWHIKDPVVFTLSDSLMKMNPLCWQSTDKYICAQGEWKKQKNKQFISAKLAAKLDQLNMLAVFYPQLHNPKGQLSINLKLTGTSKKPKIVGAASLENASVELPTYGLNLQHINASFFSQNKKLRYKAKLDSGNGQLQVTGNTLLNQYSFPTNLTIIGKNFLVYNTPEIQIWMSPKLKAQIQSKKITLNGDVTIPKANIAPLSFNNTVTLPDDVVYVNNNGQPIEKQSKLNLYSHIKLILGDQVEINTMGLKGNLQGKISIQEIPHQVTKATGQLAVSKATYTAFGQTLKVTQAQLNFTNSPVNNPGINAQAVRVIKGLSPQNGISFQPTSITVGVRVQGTLKKPKLSLFSQPATLSQQDILSYLVIGQSFDTASKSKANTQLLLQAASLFQDKSGILGNLTNQIRQTLGLSELSLQSQTNAPFSSQTNTSSALNSQTNSDEKKPLENTSLVLGKYLTPRLYLSYSIGLLQPINTLRVRYTLNKHWSLQSENNSLGSGVDLLYTIERN